MRRAGLERATPWRPPCRTRRCARRAAPSTRRVRRRPTAPAPRASGSVDRDEDVAPGVVHHFGQRAQHGRRGDHWRADAYAALRCADPPRHQLTRGPTAAGKEQRPRLDIPDHRSATASADRRRSRCAPRDAWTTTARSPACTPPRDRPIAARGSRSPCATASPVQLVRRSRANRRLARRTCGASDRARRGSRWRAPPPPAAPEETAPRAAGEPESLCDGRRCRWRTATPRASAASRAAIRRAARPLSRWAS